jgi:hypothetical protein
MLQEDKLRRKLAWGWGPRSVYAKGEPSLPAAVRWPLPIGLPEVCCVQSENSPAQSSRKCHLIDGMGWDGK